MHTNYPLKRLVVMKMHASFLLFIFGGSVTGAELQLAMFSKTVLLRCPEISLCIMHVSSVPLSITRLPELGGGNVSVGE